jgi:branched-subunit amino acid transport protein
MNPDYLWAVIVGMTVITFVERFSFIGLLSGRQLPVLLRRALRFVPPAALSAIIVPDLLYRGGQLADLLSNERLLAALIATIVAFRTKSVLLTIGAGMAMLWLLQAL